MPDLKGVDVASWQGLPSQWAREPGAQGIHWAAVKFTELEASGGRYVNPDAKADWDYLHQHGLGRIAYLYAHPSRGVGETLALFKAETDRLGLLDTDGVAVDLEVTDGLSPVRVSSWARELAAEMARVYGRRPIIYTFEDFIHQGNCDGLGNYHLWIASIRTPGVPRIPGVWHDWFAQQYSQAGGLDQDVAHFSTLSAMQAAMGKPAAPPRPPLPPSPPVLPVLREGDRGGAVAAWQATLNKLAAKGGLAGVTVDGIFGPKTKAATVALQHWAHITADGIVGPQTRAAAAAGLAPPRQVEAVWVTAGQGSMVAWSHVAQTEIPEALRRTLLASANHQWEPALKEYLTQGDLNAKMPAGIHLRYLKTERA